MEKRVITKNVCINKKQGYGNIALLFLLDL